ncbi:metallophosphoesterase [Pseudomonas fluorescens]|nr:metallophosphoesterase [Pseudomonas fluorescens]
MKTTGSPNSRVEVYTQERMVNWIGPLQLLRTGFRVAVATTLGAFVDQREVQASLRPASENQPIKVEGNADGEVWVDYLADTGDGWDSTYSMALCVSHTVQLQDQDLTLPRGHILLLGGDQVYPTPAQCGYRTRFLDPFRAASPAPVPACPPRSAEDPIPVTDPRLMLATPGNHDWYDGLRAFTQLFCNKKPIGDWETRQRTSYYVVQLPGGWWIWGLDLQLESAIDQPQRDYFEQQKRLLQSGDRVVVVTPEPSWLDEAASLERGQQSTFPSIETQTPRFRSLRDIEELLGAYLAVVLTGDLHHYARYAPSDNSGAPHRITCGGGGAFLHGTHQLPDTLTSIKVGGIEQNYALKGVYPEKEASERLRDRAWRLPTRNFAFCTMLAMFYMLFGWIVQSASLVSHPVRDGRSLMERMSELEFGWGNLIEVCHQQAWAMANSPASVIIALVIVAAGGAFTSADVMRGKWLAFFAGSAHGLLHLCLAVGMLWLMARINIHYLGWDVFDLLQAALFGLESLLLGGFLGGLLFGVWMVMANKWFGLHAEAVMSSQRIPDHKCFLRMRFTSEDLTIYPLKLGRVCRRWSLAPAIQHITQKQRSWRIRATAGTIGPRFVPATGQPSPIESLQLIEPAIAILRSSSSNTENPLPKGRCDTSL